jgi:uncharacterized protein (DUF2141 family)
MANGEVWSSLSFRGDPATSMNLEKSVRMPAKSLMQALAAPALAATAAAILATSAQAQECDGAPTNTKLIVQVDGVRSSQGLMAVTLYPDDPDRFLRHHGSLKVVRTAAKAPTTDVCLYLPAPGYYGIAVYHDENGNRKLDKSGFFPSEGSGLSNNPKVVFYRLPPLKNSRFNTHAGDNHIEISLRYPK